MATIVCYGDSNTWGAIPMVHRDALARFEPSQRWPGVMLKRLGPDHAIVEEGLNGRTTCRDDPVDGVHKNGVRFLPVVLETHAPIDLIIIMLGTNDLKVRMAMQPGDIADGAGVLVDMARRFDNAPKGKPPSVLLISPAPVVKLSWLAEMFQGAEEKSRRLAAEMARVAGERRVAFLDAGMVIASSPVDGIHLDREAQAKLGEAVADIVAKILANG